MERRELVIERASRGYRLFTPPTLVRPGPSRWLSPGTRGNTAESPVETTQLDVAAAAIGILVTYPEAASGLERRLLLHRRPGERRR
ncbi:MAG: hypothetical protein ACRD1K_21310 [Acidimicrobiales bacterium]